MSLQRLKLCVDHNHLHGGKAYFGSNHDDCTICQRMGYSEQSPPPTSNFDYDAICNDECPEFTTLEEFDRHVREDHGGLLIKFAVCAGCGNSVGVRLYEGPPTSCKEHS